ncbi:MAG TPA: ArsI/CadI family heavy metal resistance metalloenzyme [Pyrinomonadaceae bacterium]|jgi:catechol 2,3-dioxygenase-like lactoylglutathione lyase family enzyme|nr:ArsI/CadI family heavy metal resistance metalloenzyme [Pyrinomonadaceae bacterium]
MEKETNTPVQALKAHLALNVNDVERSTEFYKKALGLEPVKVRRGYAKFDVENPPLNLTLNQVPVTEPGALSHLGIQLASTEDVLAMRQTWIDRGLQIEDEMQTNCCYALQDKTWVRDPDGNQLEAFVVLKDHLAETTTCCGTGELEQSKSSATKAGSATKESAALNDTQTATSCCAPAAVSTSATADAAAASVCCDTTAAATPVTISR